MYIYNVYIYNVYNAYIYNVYKIYLYYVILCIYIYICNVIIYIYMCIFQNALISAFSQISACGLSGQKMTPQAESGFIHMSRYSDKILVDDPGEKKCSVGDVRCFFILVLKCDIFFGRKHPRNGRKHPRNRRKHPK